MKIIISLFSIIIITQISIAQDEIESYFEDNESSGFNNSEIEAIEYYRQNPINLLESNPEELIRLKVLSLSDAKLIYNFIQKHEDFDYSMLKDSLFMSSEIKFILESCTYIKYKKETDDFSMNYRSTYKSTFEEKEGFKQNKYQGTPLDLNNRISLSNKSFEAGILTDKKEGEELLFETFSAYVKFSSDNFNAIAGDFNIDFAGGSLFSGAFGKRKSTSGSADIIYLGDGITPNRSTMISDAFRGISLSGNYYSFFGKMNITAFYSNMKRGATVNENNTVTSIYSAGYYRTENEKNKKNQLDESLSGLNIQFLKNNLIYGINGYYLQYDKNVITDAQSNFSGENGLFSSAYLYYNYEDYFVNAEFSLDANSNESLILNFENVFENQKLAVNFRHLSDDFRSPFGNVLSENSYIGNEMGIYMGYEIRTKLFRINFYSDLYKTYSSTYFVPFPVKGLDLMGEMKYIISNSQDVLIRIKSENKSDSFKDYSVNSKVVSQLSKTYLRVDYSTEFRKFYLRTRYEYTFNNSKYNSENGFLGFFQLKYNTKKIVVDSRLTIFDTESYDSAIWLFEYAVPGYISTVPLYGQGYRITLGFKFSLYSQLDLRFRYAKTVKNNIDEIGSGYEAIEDNQRSDLIIQILYSF